MEKIDKLNIIGRYDVRSANFSVARDRIAEAVTDLFPDVRVLSRVTDDGNGQIMLSIVSIRDISQHQEGLAMLMDAILADEAKKVPVKSGMSI